MNMNITASRITQRQNVKPPFTQNQPPPRQRLRRWALLAAALTLFPAGSAWAGASVEHPRLGLNSQPFSRIFVFGDSLSDTGNFYRLSGGYPPPPYFQGRFSNGLVWVEHLAHALGMEIAAGDNYAVAGATTGLINYNGSAFPGLLGEIASFTATRNAAEAEGALFVVWAGANDFFVALQTGQAPAELIGNGVGHTVQAIQQLWQSGARHIMVANIPDLGLTPFALEANIGAPVTQLSAAYNQVLESALDDLAAAGIPTIRVDAFATLRTMVAQPAEFGFTNVTDQLIIVGGNPDEFLFWNEVHPTTAGHAVFAEAAADSLISYFSPRQGQGTPAPRINALNGLVNAWDNN
jgi:thermolabile hemolysin